MNGRHTRPVLRNRGILSPVYRDHYRVETQHIASLRKPRVTLVKKIAPRKIVCSAKFKRFVLNRFFILQPLSFILNRCSYPPASRHTCATKKHTSIPIATGSRADTAVHLALPVSL